MLVQLMAKNTKNDPATNATMQGVATLGQNQSENLQKAISGYSESIGKAVTTNAGNISE